MVNLLTASSLKFDLILSYGPTCVTFQELSRTSKNFQDLNNSENAGIKMVKISFLYICKYATL